MKIQREQVTINLNARPDEIPLFQTKELPLIINDQQVQVLYDKIKSGKLIGLNYIALSANLWEQIKKALIDNDLYQKAAEKWMDDVEKQVEKINNPD